MEADRQTNKQNVGIAKAADRPTVYLLNETLKIYISNFQAFAAKGNTTTENVSV